MTRPNHGDYRVVEGEPGTFIIEEFDINQYSFFKKLFKIGRWHRCYYQVYWDKELAIKKAEEFITKRKADKEKRQKEIEFAKRKKNIIWTEK